MFYKNMTNGKLFYNTLPQLHLTCYTKYRLPTITFHCLHSIKIHLKQVFRNTYRQELGTKLSQKPWTQELAKIPDWPRRQLQNFDCALGMIAWEHIFNALESVPTPTACCAASTKPWTEII